MKQAPHIAAAAFALLLSVMAAVAFTAYANLFEQKYIHAVAGTDHSSLNNGSAIERMALKQDDLLIIYGASELTLLDSKYEATRFFSAYPTGFMVFNVATLGGSNLTIAQKFAGLGEDLCGRRIILAVGPAIMTMAPYGEVNVRHYDANFSPLNVLEMLYSPALSMETKRIASQRMLNFPGSLENQPFIRFTLERLAEYSWVDRILYYLSWPLGRLQIILIRLQDHYATVSFIRTLSAQDVNITHQAQDLDWEALISVAEKEQIAQTDSNSFRVDNSQWPKIKELFITPVPFGSKDAEFIYDVESAREWQDLEIALRVIKELGADVVVLGMPINAPLWETIGVSENAQNMYYQKLRSVVTPYDLPIVDLKEYGRVEYFSMDLASHTSRKGWIYVNRILDSIFHGVLP